jgi:hypothetical protein
LIFQLSVLIDKNQSENSNFMSESRLQGSKSVKNGQEMTKKAKNWT